MGKKKKPAEKQKKDKIEFKKISDMMLPPEVKDDLVNYEAKIDTFLQQVYEKFDKYVVSFALLPPPKELPPKLKPEEIEKIKQRINILVVVDDSEPSKMHKQELRDKILAIIDKMAVDIDPRIYPDVMLVSSIWQHCFDSKYDVINLIAGAQSFYDKGILQALRLAQLHKSLVLERFSKYIVSYVLAGSIVQGKATEESDVDVFVVIDDTDVKNLTRAELKDKLRSIIISLGLDAGDKTGIRNKLNIQPYLLTDFWESVKEAHPVIFTFLRDGVPLHDRGVFMPWKQLLRMGRIKPSPEAIDSYMKSGEQVLSRVKLKMREMGMEDFFWATLTPSQAALMMLGIPPPTPKEAAEVMREIFVKREKLLKDADVNILDNIIKVRKDLEHGTKKEISGKELDKLIDDADKYLKKIKELFEKIGKIKDKESVVHTYDSLVTVMRDILVQEGHEKVKEKDLVKVFEDEIVSAGIVPAKYMRMIHDVVGTAADVDKGKAKHADVTKVRKFSGELLRFLIEHLQRVRGQSLARARIRVKVGQTFGEILVLEDAAYVNLDLDAKERKMQVGSLKSDGTIGTLKDVSYDEFEKAIAKAKIPQRVFIKEATFESLKRIFGKDVEILVSI